MRVQSNTGRRTLLSLFIVTLVIASVAGPVGAQAATEPMPQQQVTEPMPQQQLVTELNLRASLTGDFVVVAGWFQLTAMAEGYVDTGAQETDLGGTYDIGFAETLGEFQFRGEVVGAINASRVLVTFEGDASSFGGGEAAIQPTGFSTTGESVRSGLHAGLDGAYSALSLYPENRERVEPAQSVGSIDERVYRNSSVVLPATPLQLTPWRALGISFLDLYWQLSTLLLGVVVVGLLPRFSRRIADLGAAEPLRTGGAGLAVVFVVPIALAVLGLSLFGIPLAIAGAAIYLVVWWLGAVYGRFTLGHWLLGAISRALAAVDVDSRRVENRWAGLLVGTAAVGLLAVIPVLGPIIEAVILLLGLGGIARLAFQSYRRTERAEGTHRVTVASNSDDE